MTFWTKFKEFNNTSLLPRVLPGYYVDNSIMRVAIFLVAVLLILAGYSIGWKGGVYVACTAPTPCDNPFYTGIGSSNNICPAAAKEIGLCNRKFINPGEKVGTPPSLLYKIVGEGVFLIIALALLLNHALYNRGYRRPKNDLDFND